MTKVLIICGPTASGKTNTGVLLAKRFGGELVSADSRQVYKGLDIVSGKDIPQGSVFEPREQIAIRGRTYTLGTHIIDGVPVWMYDVASPDEQFSVSQYREAALAAIANITARNILPIIVGGAGLYLEALVNPPDTIDVPVNPEARERWAGMQVSELQRELEGLVPDRYARMNNSDRNNPRRLVRALEVALWRHGDSNKPMRPDYDPLWIGLRLPDADLSAAIRDRVRERWERGAPEEVRQLRANGADPRISSALGVSHILSYLAGETDEQTACDEWTRDEIAYAKRQMTWFAKKTYIHWYEAGKHDTYDAVEKRVSEWYT